MSNRRTPDVGRLRELSLRLEDYLETGGITYAQWAELYREARAAAGERTEAVEVFRSVAEPGWMERFGSSAA